MQTPIFVLGNQRSGTTWLANQICQHPAVAGVKDEKGNVFESVYFAQLCDRYGDIENRSNYLEFVTTLAESLYVHHAGVTREDLLALYPTTYAGLFRTLMDRLAEEQGCRWWLEKSPHHTIFAREIRSFYPDARFVAIVRDPLDQLASGLNLRRIDDDPRLRQPGPVRSKVIRFSAVRSVLYDKYIHAFTRSTGSPLVRYEDLKADLPGTLRKICEGIGLDYHEDMAVTAAKARSSFKSDAQRNEALTDREKKMFLRVYGMAKAVPLGLLKKLARWRSGSRTPLPPWFFRTDLRRALPGEEPQGG